ncbi:MAG: 30S ribosomal protein S18 [Phycisphaerales bacterium]
MSDIATETVPAAHAAPKQKLVIDYKNVEDLRRLISGNGKIVSRKRAGASAKDQKKIAQAIKRARFLALLPYTHGMGN